MRIGREVRRHPVEDHADASLVRPIDKTGEAGRIAEARGGREQSRRLVAPGRVEGMLRDRQQLDMREPEIGDVGEQLVADLVVGQKPAVAAQPPRAEMHLVDRDGRAPRIVLPGAEVRLVVPYERRRIGDH